MVSLSPRQLVFSTGRYRALETSSKFPTFVHECRNHVGQENQAAAAAAVVVAVASLDFGGVGVLAAGASGASGDSGSVVEDA